MQLFYIVQSLRVDWKKQCDTLKEGGKTQEKNMTSFTKTIGYVVSSLKAHYTRKDFIKRL